MFRSYFPRVRAGAWDDLRATFTSHAWFKMIGITAFISVFFAGYFHVLRHPASAVTIMPITFVDEWVGIHPYALVFYLSLWLYGGLAPFLLGSRKALLEYGLWIGGLCLSGLAIFYFWPTAVRQEDVDWSRFAGMAFLKQADASGNACPSLHVATAVFSAMAIHERFRHFGLWQGFSLGSYLWCAGIIYSTMATRQHVSLDALAGGLLGVVFALGYLRLGSRGNASG